MKTSVYESLIEELNKKVDEFNDKYDLFCGGCCYAAYVLADILQGLGIKYRIGIFQYKDILNVKNFNMAINGNGVSHVAVEVKYKGQRITIGSCAGIYRYFNFTGEEYNIRIYKNVSPEEILAGYRNNEWNHMYKHQCYNGLLTRELRLIATKYASEI